MADLFWAASQQRRRARRPNIKRLIVRIKHGTIKNGAPRPAQAQTSRVIVVDIVEMEENEEETNESDEFESQSYTSDESDIE
ncbi:hypothetical protein EVAR_37190_1 [Eumeta japonica]|uniref:Uncharacterized protein n=1 Tax=Eumeta variegata TaxID=151549 RepID=A0A4C1WKL9_EUMVA|nr:hypothetical protein EVAR_37190_1 [Eumeta japonica]